MLELRPICENCAKLLPPSSTEAMICSFECTYCRECTQALDNVCPNCGGGFTARPIRPANNLKNDNYLATYPASTKLKHRPVDMAIHATFARSIKLIAPENR